MVNKFSAQFATIIYLLDLRERCGASEKFLAECLERHVEINMRLTYPKAA